jgi:hypothetical protein
MATVINLAEVRKHRFHVLTDMLAHARIFVPGDLALGSSLSGHGERFGLEFYTDTTRPNGYFARRAVRPPAHDSIFIPAVQMRRNSSSAALLNQSIQGNRSSACLKPQPLSSPP